MDGLIKNISVYEFRDTMKAIRPDNFSYEGLTALYEWLNDLSDNTGQPIEYDPIAICCDFTEYDNWEEFAEGYTDFECYKLEHLYGFGKEKLKEETTVIHGYDSEKFIIQNY